MPSYFFDSSALVKLYHVEVGTPLVDSLATASGSVVRISGFTPAEIVSAFAIKVRTRSIGRSDADVLVHQFLSDIAAGQLNVVSVAEPEFALAEALVRRYAFEFRLRSLDALQLAVAISLRVRNLVDHFVAADRVLCEVAGLEGFSVINPEDS